jgi:2-haloacid dehalogenase
MSKSDVEKLKQTIKICMFDQYGTVVDMQSGLVKIATPYLKAKGWTGDPNSFVTWWRRTHFENSMIDALLHKAHTPYREIGQRAVDFVLERAGIPHTDEEVRGLVAEIEKLTCFPEVPEALAKLHAKYRLVVLSNGDPDMLEAAKVYHKIPFDRVISVAEANSFKPTPRRPRSWAWRWTRCFSSPTMRSIVSAPKPPACAPPSLTAAAAPSASRPISRTFWRRR